MRRLVAGVPLGVLLLPSLAYADPTAPPTEESASAPAVVVAPPPPMAPPQAPPEERTANNALYVEGFGPGLIYSVDYDRAFGDFAARVGVGYFSFGVSDGEQSSSASFLSVPITVSYLGIGSKKHMFEVGGGVAIFHAGAGANGLYVDEQGHASATAVVGTLILGYRLQPPGGGFFLRAGLSPLISKYGFLPWPHIGLGATF